MIECESCGTRNPDDLDACSSCGARLGSTSRPSDDAREADEAEQAQIGQLRVAVQRLVSARLAESAPYGAAARPPIGDTTAAAFRLVTLAPDGTPGQSYPVGDSVTDIGRTVGDLVFQDPFLAERHARIVASGDGHLVRPLEPHNGVFRKLRAPAELVGGDRILLGRELLRFELVSEAERTTTYAAENGVALFGSRVRPAWGRLLELTPAGVVRDVFHLARGEILLGRERADIVFAHDELMSPLHARLTMRGGRVALEDLKSRSGTFVSVRGSHPLEPGDVIRVGNQLFRLDRVPA
jgi:pSer/pThr/pTyr-binding forkhead associated (FHA) protein